MATLGPDIIQWWDELKSASNTMNIFFGGPTGIYTVIVLMSWWSALLNDRPDSELTDFVRILDEINRAILAAIQNARVKTPAQSLRSAPPQARGTKRTISEEPSSRKRLHMGPA